MMHTAMQRVAAASAEGAALRTAFFAEQGEHIVQAARNTAIALALGHKILLCGNGGSAADAQHIAAELVNRYLIDRPPLAAIALTTDSSILTSIGNDFGYEQTFSKQVLALGQPGDIVLCYSTSGTSKNIVAALEAAKSRGLYTIGLTGQSGGLMRELCDLLITVPHQHTPYIQEMHAAAGHLFCNLIDYFLFEDVALIQNDIEQGLWPLPTSQNYADTI